MPITLPNLDDRRFDQLLDEARALIPGLCPEWTNLNPTDPGMVLVEMFAWLTEMTLYELNQVPDENYRVFLKLLNGGEDTSGLDLETAIRQTLHTLGERYRAVTAEDYEWLVTNRWRRVTVGELLPLLIDPRDEDGLKTVGELKTSDPNQLAISVTDSRVVDLSEKLKNAKPHPDLARNVTSATTPALPTVDDMLTALGPQAVVTRATCVPRVDLTTDNTDKEQSDHVSLLVQPEAMKTAINELRSNPAENSSKPGSLPDPLLSAIWAFLDERRLVATLHHVVQPRLIPITITATLNAQRGVPKAQLQQDASDRFRNYYEPFLPEPGTMGGGSDGNGWPIGRGIYESEVFALLQQTPGFQSVEDLRMTRVDQGGRQQPDDSLAIVNVAPDELAVVKTQFST